MDFPAAVPKPITLFRIQSFVPEDDVLKFEYSVDTKNLLIMQKGSVTKSELDNSAIRQIETNFKQLLGVKNNLLVNAIIGNVQGKTGGRLFTIFYPV